MNKLELYKAAREVISSRQNWISGTYAVDCEDNPVSGDDPEAVRWCAVGALAKIVGNKFLHQTTELHEAAHNLYSVSTIQKVNDHIGQQAVLKCYDYAIEQLEKKQLHEEVAIFLSEDKIEDKILELV